MSAAPLPERRLMHEIAGDGRERHHMRKRVDHRAGELNYYTCECGAEADRFGNTLPEVTLDPPRWWQ